MRTALLVPLVFAFALLNAQSWCPPGATWTYTYSNSWTTEGFARFEFVGDTLVGSDTCQLIDANAEGWYYPFDTTFHNDLGPVVTKVNGDLVSILTTTGFDTLYWFGATLGDHWRITLGDGSLGPYEVTISDTGTTHIDGVALKYLVSGTDTMVERLGSLYRFMLPWNGFVVDEPGGPLRCYQDAEINHKAPWWVYGCDSWLDVEELHDQSAADIFPNPGTDHFTLQSPPGPNTITMHDALGRSVLVQRTTGGNVEIDASDLPPGTYVVRTITASGSATHAKWIKH